MKYVFLSKDLRRRVQRNQLVWDANGNRGEHNLLQTLCRLITQGRESEGKYKAYYLKEFIKMRPSLYDGSPNPDITN